MADDRQMTCKAKKGMLILRDCGRTAIASCAACGRSVCRDHQTNMNDGSTNCPECAALAADQGQVDDAALPKSVRRVRRRRRHYDSYHYHSPYYMYGGHSHMYHSDRSYYGGRDYDTLGARSETPHEAGGTVTDDFGDSYDAMES